MSVADELKRLHELHLAGGITAGEWARLKASLLGVAAASAPPPDAADPPAGPSEPEAVLLVVDAIAPDATGGQPAALPNAPELSAAEAAPRPPSFPAVPTPPPGPTAKPTPRPLRRPAPAPAPKPPRPRREWITPGDRSALSWPASIGLFCAAVVGLVRLGVVPVSWAAQMPFVAGFYRDTCLECTGTGKAKVKCGKCFGGGVVSGARCAACGGTGSAEAACPKCAGSGKKSYASSGGAR